MQIRITRNKATARPREELFVLTNDLSLHVQLFGTFSIHNSSWNLFVLKPWSQILIVHCCRSIYFRLVSSWFFCCVMLHEETRKRSVEMAMVRDGVTFWNDASVHFSNSLNIIHFYSTLYILIYLPTPESGFESVVVQHLVRDIAP